MTDTMINPRCHACHGTGVDEAFGGRCVECERFDTTRFVDPVERTAREHLDRFASSDGPGRGPARSLAATDKQIAFLSRLHAERTTWQLMGGDAEIMAQVEHVLQTGNLSKAGASEYIDALLATADPRTGTKTADAPTTRRPNRYGGSCHECGGYVGEGAGWLDKIDGRWATHHHDCPDVEYDDDDADDDEGEGDGYEPKKGDVHVIDGTYYRIHVAQRTGRPYAARAVITARAVWDVDDDGDRVLIEAGEITWEYAKGMIFRLSTSTMATAEQSAAFGEMVGRCCYCSHAIDTPESVQAGYGPVCASKYGLPWG